MTTIVYVGDDRAMPVADPAMTILDVSIAHKIPHVRECGGHGRCTTCRVRICDGIQNVSARTPREVEVADALALGRVHAPGVPDARQRRRDPRTADQEPRGRVAPAGGGSVDRAVGGANARGPVLRHPRLHALRRRAPRLRRGAHPQSLLQGGRRRDPGQQRCHLSVCRRPDRRAVRCRRRSAREELSRHDSSRLGHARGAERSQCGAVGRIRNDARDRHRGAFRPAHRRHDGASGSSAVHGGRRCDEHRQPHRRCEQDARYEIPDVGGSVRPGSAGARGGAQSASRVEGQARRVPARGSDRLCRAGLRPAGAVDHRRSAATSETVHAGSLSTFVRAGSCGRSDSSVATWRARARCSPT